MRDLRFRAWNEDDKVMHYNYQNLDTNFPLMQSTGLKDITQTNVYEGDIVKFNNHGERKATVKWEDYDCCYMLKVDNPYEGQDVQILTGALDGLEVIGNIYE